VTAGPALFLLAVDHRRSFEQLFGVDEPVAEADRARMVAAKSLVAEALGDVAAERAVEEHGEQLGILIDDVYGGAAIDAARRAGVAVALAFERSGRTVLEFEHSDWRDRLASDPPTFAKVLIRHRADGDPADVDIQLERLREISDACAAAAPGFLLELLTPYTEAELAAAGAERLELEVRPRLVVEAVHQIQEAGVEPDVWKVEGVADVAGCAAIATAVRRRGRDGVRVVVLGAGAPPSTVDAWLGAAAGGGYAGFAVGRSIWSEAVLAHDRGELGAEAARAEIAARYRAFIETFRTAARSRR
jgi:myo-inositol catabolism protein IolC